MASTSMTLDLRCIYLRVFCFCSVFCCCFVVVLLVFLFWTVVSFAKDHIYYFQVVCKTNSPT